MSAPRTEKLKDWTVGRLQDNLLITAYAHHAVGFEEAAGFLKREAGELFVADEHELAQYALAASKNMSDFAKTYRDKQRDAQLIYDTMYDD